MTKELTIHTISPNSVPFKVRTQLKNVFPLGFSRRFNAVFKRKVIIESFGADIN